MSPFPALSRLEVSEDGTSRFGPGDSTVQHNQLEFQHLEVALGDGVGIIVALAALTREHAMRRQLGLIRRGCVPGEFFWSSQHLMSELVDVKVGPTEVTTVDSQ